MAQPDLSELLVVVPSAAGQVFTSGDERQALQLLRDARDAQGAHTAAWAVLERLVGLVLIHQLREVEGTFALERADAILDGLNLPRPTLEWLSGADLR